VADEAKTTVTVSVAGCSVTIVAAESADEMTKLALATLAEARRYDDGRIGPAAAGFTSQVDAQYNHDRQQGSMWRPVRAGFGFEPEVSSP
jgi:hypothetical protein